MKKKTPNKASKSKNQKKTISKKVKTTAKKTGIMKKLMGRLLKSKKVSKKAAPKKVKVAPKKKVVKKASKKVTKIVKKSVKKVQKKLVKKVSSKKTQKTAKKVMKAVKKSVAKKAVQVQKSQKPSKSVVKNEKVKAQPVQNQPEKQMTEEVSPFNHEPVLVEEILESLKLADKKVVVDGTLGLGGHSRRMLEAMTDGKLIGFDVDDDNMAVARKNLASFGDRAVFVRSNFSNLQEELSKLNINGVDAILLDLGLSSPQVDNAEKGFSFLREGPLDMRFDKNQSLTAAEVINTYPLNTLIKIFFEFGEERFARKIATEIVRRRKARSFKTTTELANFVEKLIGRQGHIHPATRIFQALRIEVNHELDVLASTLQQVVAVLNKGGRLAVIAYHSLEDRVVKQFFKESARDYINEPDKLTTTHLEPTLDIITKKPVVPSESEIAKNPRSRSAKLRVAEKL